MNTPGINAKDLDADKTLTKNTEFDQDEFLKAYPDGIQNDYWNTARNKTICNYVKKHGLNNILDVGCGRGIVTHFLSTRGIKITGVELGNSKPIVDDVPIYYNTDAIDLPADIRNKIEAISLFDVIEHIEDPVQFIKNLLPYFPNIKHLLITVPACQELWSNYDEFYGHFRRYDLELIEDTMNKVGFKVRQKQYFFHPLYPVLKMQAASNKKRNIVLHAPKGAIAKLIHKAIGIGLYLDGAILPGTIKGTSVICVAEINK